MLGEIYRVSMIGHRIVEDFDIEEKLYNLFCNMLRTKEYVEIYLNIYHTPTDWEGIASEMKEQEVEQEDGMSM